MIVTVGSKFRNKKNSLVYEVISISTIKLNGKWIEDDLAVTYKNNVGNTFTRLESDFCNKFEYTRC